QSQLVRDVGAELPRVVRPGDVNHVGPEFARRLYRPLRMSPEEHVVPEIGVQPEAEVPAPKRKLRHDAFDGALRARAAMDAEQGKMAPFGESRQHPARVRDAVDLDERIGKERDARLNSHNSSPPGKIPGYASLPACRPGEIPIDRNQPPTSWRRWAPARSGS